MFGEKYSRQKYWLVLLSLLVLIVILRLIEVVAEAREDADLMYLAAIGYLVVAFMQLNTLANRIRDYGSNPWIAAFSLIPLVNIGLALYYGIVQYEKKLEDNQKTVNASNSSLTKSDTHTSKPSINFFIYNSFV